MTIKPRSLAVFFFASALAALSGVIGVTPVLADTMTPAAPNTYFSNYFNSNNSNSNYAYEIDIPAISVDAGVVAEGLTAAGRMMVPSNFHDVGWYASGAKPGEIGTAVLGAHVDNGGNTPGVFKNLKSLQAGDGIFIKSADGTSHYYRVSALKVYDKDAKDTSEIFGSSDSSRIAIITCYGKWLPKQRTYQGRLVVFADEV